MIIDIAPNEVLELSLFLRALIYAVGWSLMGLWLLSASDRIRKYEKALAVVCLLTGAFNALMAIEWLYFFFFTDATLQ
jgi:diacylglycerol kinase